MPEGTYFALIDHLVRSGLAHILSSLFQQMFLSVPVRGFRREKKYKHHPSILTLLQRTMDQDYCQRYSGSREVGTYHAREDALRVVLFF